MTEPKTWWRVPGATPGPWEAAHCAVWIEGDRSARQLADCAPKPSTSTDIVDELHANSQMMALAPRMSAEIDRLRAALEQIAAIRWQHECLAPPEIDDAIEYARASLDGEGKP